jgi:hypothetical protein
MTARNIGKFKGFDTRLLRTAMKVEVALDPSRYLPWCGNMGEFLFLDRVKGPWRKCCVTTDLLSK